MRGFERCLSSICRHCATTIVQRMEQSEPVKKVPISSFPRSSSTTDEAVKAVLGWNENALTAVQMPNAVDDAMRMRWSLSPIVLHASVFSTVSPLLYRHRPSSIQPAKKQQSELPSGRQGDAICSVDKIIVDGQLVESVLGPPKHQIQSPEDHLQGTGHTTLLAHSSSSSRCCSWTCMDTVWRICAIH